MRFAAGIDNLLADSSRFDELRRARVGLVANPASVDGQQQHSVDALMDAGVNLVAAFGPQHGMRGEKQDNMIETEDYFDPERGIPVISLYGEHRRPTPAMLEDLDIVLFDLQDIGCRIYTYITTLRYFLEAAGAAGVAIWVLDRPNPAGRPVDGLRLVAGEESFVGCDLLPTRHGLTTGELARWFVATGKLDVDLRVINMSGYTPSDAPGFGWPLLQRAWINPSPNASSLNMARCFAGTVLLEGTTLSEGRGTTTPLEVIGAPTLPFVDLLSDLRSKAPAWCEGVYIRPCYFQPTFHKHTGTLCTGLQFHTDYAGYRHEQFQPYRLIAGLLKVIRQHIPGYDLWRYHAYEYELDRTPIDVINGGPGLRTWVDDPDAGFDELAQLLDRQLADWVSEREPFLVYK
ncbi:MAG: exo-beta-N-acetylmuramidase NamZ domain-containing protein [Pseudomonadota bacterium]